MDNIIKQDLINKIKEIESLVYDIEVIRLNYDQIRELSNLYKKLKTPLSPEDKKEVIKNRRQKMIEETGDYAEFFIYKNFNDSEVIYKYKLLIILCYN